MDARRVPSATHIQSTVVALLGVAILMGLAAAVSWTWVIELHFEHEEGEARTAKSVFSPRSDSCATGRRRESLVCSRQCQHEHKRTVFRIDLPTRSGHIEGDGRCRGGSGQDEAARAVRES